MSEQQNTQTIPTDTVNIENGIIYLKLPPEATAQITLALEGAQDHLVFTGEEEMTKCQILATLFRSCTIAAVSQWQITPDGVNAIRKDIAALLSPVAAS